MNSSRKVGLKTSQKMWHILDYESQTIEFGLQLCHNTGV